MQFNFPLKQNNNEILAGLVFGGFGLHSEPEGMPEGLEKANFRMPDPIHSPVNPRLGIRGF